MSFEDERNTAASKYRQCIESEEYAVGRTQEKKLIQGIMVGLAFSAGADWAKEWIEREQRRQWLERKADKDVLSGKRFTLEDE
jgi:protein involved in sex pheromone biosynthesis